MPSSIRIGTARLDISGSAAGLVRASRRASRALNRNRRDVRRWRSAVVSASRSAAVMRRNVRLLQGAFAAAGLGLGVGALLRATGEQQRAVALVETRLRSLQGETRLTSRGLQEMASGLQDVTTYGDETILRLQSILLTFRSLGQVGPDTFRRITETALNMAEATGQDARSAVRQLALAIEDSEGLTQLRRTGVTFTIIEKEEIARLREANDVLGLTTKILDVIEGQVGGTARAVRDTLPGAFSGFRNALGDLFEAPTTGANKLRDALEEVTATLREPETIQAFQNFTSSLVTGLGDIVANLENMAGWINRNRRLLAALAAGATGAKIGSIAGGKGALAGGLAAFLAAYFTVPDAELDAAEASIKRLNDLNRERRELLRLSSEIGRAALLPVATAAQYGYEDPVSVGRALRVVEDEIEAEKERKRAIDETAAATRNATDAFNRRIASDTFNARQVEETARKATAAIARMREEAVAAAGEANRIPFAQRHLVRGLATHAAAGFSRADARALAARTIADAEERMASFAAFDRDILEPLINPPIDEADRAIDSLIDSYERLDDVAVRSSHSFQNFFDTMIFDAERASEAWRRLATDILRAVSAQYVTEPISNAIGSFISAAAGGVADRIFGPGPAFRGFPQGRELPTASVAPVGAAAGGGFTQNINITGGDEEGTYRAIAAASAELQELGIQGATSQFTRRTPERAGVLGS